MPTIGEQLPSNGPNKYEEICCSLDIMAPPMRGGWQ
jgi:hypothetical protein